MTTFQYTDHVRLWDAVIEVLKEYDPDEDGFKDAEDIKEEAYRNEFGNHVPFHQRPTCYCFACDYTDKESYLESSTDKYDRCLLCPLNWSASSDMDICISDDDEGLYDYFSYAVGDNNIDAAIDYAEQIRDTPVKEGVDFI